MYDEQHCTYVHILFIIHTPGSTPPGVGHMASRHGDWGEEEEDTEEDDVDTEEEEEEEEWTDESATPAAASQAQPPVRAGGILTGGGGSTFEWDLEPAQRLESAIACSFVRKAAGQAQPPLQSA